MNKQRKKRNLRRKSTRISNLLFLLINLDTKSFNDVKKLKNRISVQVSVENKNKLHQ